MTQSMPRIAIIGASIAGCTCAILLKRLGFNVTLLERSNHASMNLQGAGICLPTELIQQLISENLVDKKIETHEIIHREFYLKDEKGSAKLLADFPYSASSLHWHVLYQSLAKRAEIIEPFYEHELTYADLKTMQFAFNNEKNCQHFDKVIFADGYHSFGRHLLFPDDHLKLKNCILWRGMLKLSENAFTQKLKQKLQWYFYDRGVLVIYLLPDGIDLDGKPRWVINWAIYERVNKNHPLEANVGIDFKKNIPVKHFNEICRHYLIETLASAFPEPIQKILEVSENLFIQALSTVVSPAYAVGNAILLGDAAALLVPVTASGATKALQDALALKEALIHRANFDGAVRDWSQQQIQSTIALDKLGDELLHFLVLDSHEWGRFSGDRFKSAWRKITSKYNWYVEKP